MFPMMTVVQYISAKVGLVSGRGLAGVLREHYPRWVLYPALAALVIANTLNAGADIGAIAAAINLLVAVPAAVFVVPIGLGIVAVQMFGSYALVARIFGWSRPPRSPGHRRETILQPEYGKPQRRSSTINVRLPVRGTQALSSSCHRCVTRTSQGDRILLAFPNQSRRMKCIGHRENCPDCLRLAC